MKDFELTCDLRPTDYLVVTTDASNGFIDIECHNKSKGRCEFVQLSREQARQLRDHLTKIIEA